MTHMLPRVALAAGLCTVLAASPAGAIPGNGNGWAWGQSHARNSHGAPGPVAGAGLPFLIAAALLLWRASRARPGA